MCEKTINISSMKDRSAMNRAIRVYLDAAGYIEAETPLLSPSPIPETHIELFRTERLHPDGSFSPLYLLPSPEVWLKPLLAGGAPSLYQIGKCFRNGEQLDRWHRLEFSMLEWYSAGGNTEDNLKVMKGVIDSCVHAVNPQVPKDVSGDFRLMSMDEAFRTYAGFSLESDLVQSGLDRISRSSPDYVRASAEASERLANRLRERNQPAGNDQEVDDLFHRLFISLVEDRLPADVPLALTDWPSLVPTLARRRTGTPWVERWELYIRGVEVANCYGEETEIEVVRAFWTAEAPKKENAAVPVMASESWADRLTDNLPSCSGAAVGLDRLLALVRGDDSLQGLDLFPIRDIMPR